MPNRTRSDNETLIYKKHTEELVERMKIKGYDSAFCPKCKDTFFNERDVDFVGKNGTCSQCVTEQSY